MFCIYDLNKEREIAMAEYKVMIVDDAVMMRSVIRGLVSKIPNFSVVANAENGKVALEQLNIHKDLSLILLDIEMPEMDGLDLI